MTKPGVRISAGKLRGRNLAVPARARPTSARLREALFDIWRHRVAQCRFLDLFAGSGAVGLEAFSRGADSVVFVERDREASRRLRVVCAELAADTSTVIQADLPEDLARVMRTVGSGFDLIFADPPYDFDAYAELLASLADPLEMGGAVAVEHSVRTTLPVFPEGLIRQTVRDYGENRISFYSVSE